MWNEHVNDKVEAIFEFTYSLLHDDVAIIVFVLEFKKIRDNVKNFTLTYYFNILHDWWGVNEMKLYLPLNNTLAVMNI